MCLIKSPINRSQPQPDPSHPSPHSRGVRCGVFLRGASHARGSHVFAAQAGVANARYVALATAACRGETGHRPVRRRGMKKTEKRVQTMLTIITILLILTAPPAKAGGAVNRMTIGAAG